MERSALVACFQDTLRMVKETPSLLTATRQTQAGTRLYLADFDAVVHTVKGQGTPVRVVEDTTFHCAQALAKGAGKVAVLNFANAYHPGGGVERGAMAQEECLCRSSNLYCSLTLPYLLRHYYKYNERWCGDLGTDAVIYSPGVTVFKSDDALPQPLDEPFQVDVLTCAAPYIDPDRVKPLSREQLEEALSRRIRNILEVAVANDVDRLVLGAFGCGAFGNDPEMVSSCFRSLLRDRGYAGYFRETVFAIKKGGPANINFQTFRRVLAP